MRAYERRGFISDGPLFKVLTLNSNTHRITPYHFSPRGRESKCHADVSGRKYMMDKTNLGNMDKTNLGNMDKTMQK